MPILFAELKRNRLSLIIWSAALSFLIGVTVLIFPEMAEAMEELNEALKNMGAFSEVLGLDQLQITDFMGYFALECSETIGLGGAIFAAIVGVGALGVEERDRTAEFLFSHPVCRTRITLEKYLAMIVEILILNLAVILVASISMLGISAEVNFGKLALIYLMMFVLEVEIASISFAITSLIPRGGIAVGLGAAIGFYFIGLLSGISESVEFLKFFTPFSYASSSYINENFSIELKYLIVHLILTVLSVAFAFYRYNKKDIK